MDDSRTDDTVQVVDFAGPNGFVEVAEEAPPPLPSPPPIMPQQHPASKIRPIKEKRAGSGRSVSNSSNNRNTNIRHVIILVLFLCAAGTGGGFVAVWQFAFKDNRSKKVVTADSTSLSTSSHPPSPMPSAAPSESPTTIELFVAPHPIPSQINPSYFNYDASDTRFGPNQWHRVNMNMDETYYREFGQDGFGVWAGHLKFHVSNPTENRCDALAKQSPINVERTKGILGSCTATHQIRTRPGIHPLTRTEIEKRIEPNKLRLVLPRRSCLDPQLPECLIGRPPTADFPKYSSNTSQYSDLLNLDIKVPGEHRILNETFDAEIQMLHIHISASRMAQIGVPVRATVDGFNQKFQAVLDQFQRTYEMNQAACAANQLRRRREAMAAKDYAERVPTLNVNGLRRRLQTNVTSSRFDPYADFLPTFYFYRYEGSSTEPPCMTMTWFVMTHPLIISFSQLREVKRLIFTNVNEHCEPTSVHNLEQSVARPIQTLGIVNQTSGEERPVMLCKQGNFLPDDP